MRATEGHERGEAALVCTVYEKGRKPLILCMSLAGLAPVRVQIRPGPIITSDNFPPRLRWCLVLYVARIFMLLYCPGHFPLNVCCPKVPGVFFFESAFTGPRGQTGTILMWFRGPVSSTARRAPPHPKFSFCILPTRTSNPYGAYRIVTSVECLQI
jgi:hypothetical protein